MGNAPEKGSEGWERRRKAFNCDVTLLDGSKVNTKELVKDAKLVVFVVMASQDSENADKNLKELESLYQKYTPDIQIIATPTDEWIGREKGTDDEVRQRYEKYSLSFPITKRDTTFLGNTCELWDYVKGRDNNFGFPWAKLMVDKRGKVVINRGAAVAPIGDELEQAVKDYLRDYQWNKRDREYE